MGFSLRVPRPLRAVLALVVLVILAGTTYQGVTTALERRRFPHPGRLVDVGGHQLHILCSGRGSPTVVLEAPAAGLSVTWTLVQERVAGTTRVCSYDRAGLGWSERGDGPYAPAQVPAELRRLLDAAGERRPFLVAGAGLGAAFALAFAHQFPDVTAGVVQIDPPRENRASPDRASLGRFPGLAAWLSRTGALRMSRLAARSAADLPPPANGAVRAFLNRPDHLARSAIELAAWTETMRQAAAAAAAAPGAPVTTDGAPLTTTRGAEVAAEAVIDTVRAIRRAR